MFIKKSNISRKSYFMNLALIQARKSLGNTKTNPSVGCLIVKDNLIVSA
jgi:pyrimidine deaminase RibD-like protein